jgi:hypothetical protein
LTCPTINPILNPVMNPWKIKNARDKAYELLEEGMVNPQAMAEMCLQYMSTDDIEDMLLSNDIIDEEEVTE